jgi:hypothetical protein
MLSLFDPLRLGDIDLPNRIVIAPLTRCRAGAGRTPNALMRDYYVQRASAGLILSEATSVTPMGVGYPDTPGIWSEAQVEGWREITRAVHAAGGRIMLQLWHVGRISHPIYLDGALPVAPSAIAAEGHVRLLQPYPEPRSLEISEIPGVIAAYRKGGRTPCAPASTASKSTARMVIFSTGFSEIVPTSARTATAARWKRAMIMLLNTPYVPVSWGELIDKITILELKYAQLNNQLARANVKKEFELLSKSALAAMEFSHEVLEQKNSLFEVNQILWIIEDRIREKEQNKTFDAEFIELARSVYKTNDKRAAIKRRLNELLSSGIIEEKSYTPY